MEGRVAWNWHYGGYWRVDATCVQNYGSSVLLRPW